MRATVSPQPFPWRSLETTGRTQIEAIGRARRWVARHVRLDAFAAALGELVGHEVRVIVRRAGPSVPGHAMDDGLGVILTAAGEGPLSGRALLEIEPSLAAKVVTQVVRRPSPAVTRAGITANAALAGAVGAVLVAAARRAHQGLALKVLAAGASGALEAGLAGDGGEVLALGLTVVVGDEAFAARLLIASGASWEVGSPPWSAGLLSAMGAMPLSVPIVACASVAPAADVAALRVGDVWLPGSWALEGSEPRSAARGDAACPLRGEVTLAAPSSATGVRARLVDGGRLVLSGEVDALGAPEVGMMESEATTPIVEAIGDVPIVVRVEIGEARMAAREWAALGKGDVVTLGTRVGEVVLLRVAGVPVARGELVSVEGEVGVRIAEILGGDVTRA
ncbi:MAG TPA: FliM/FliN family flagellar motor switch protein [Polyangiaceae bacterium]|nr:FliM/FliN family flagellar motor switch protein [Polyangiaceae bacterium]